MTDPKHESARRAEAPSPVKSPWRTPRLEVLGNLRSVTRGTGGKGFDGARGMTMMSDRRAKEDIQPLGRHPHGIALYVYRYRTPFRDRYGAGWKVGVLADEVLVRCPEAIRQDAEGYLTVDYDRLLG